MSRSATLPRQIPTPKARAGARVGFVLLACSALGLGAVGLTGCGSQQIADAQSAIEAARDVAAIAEPCLVAAQSVELERCGDDRECKAAVIESFRPMADALDMLKEAWCKLAPASEGCEDLGGAQ